MVHLNIWTRNARLLTHSSRDSLKQIFSSYGTWFRWASEPYLSKSWPLVQVFDWIKFFDSLGLWFEDFKNQFFAIAKSWFRLSWTTLLRFQKIFSRPNWPCSADGDTARPSAIDRPACTICQHKLLVLSTLQSHINGHSSTWTDARISTLTTVN